MNCPQFEEQLVAYLEGLLDRAAADRIESHLADCPACRAELDELRHVSDRLVCDGQAASGVSLEIQVMCRIIREQALELRKMKMRKRYRLIRAGAAVAAAAAAVAFLALWLVQPDNRANAARVLAKAAQAVPELRSIHIQCRMRTPPQDNFAAIRSESDLVPVELWKQFGDQTKWRIEKPARVVVMDGKSTVMYVKGRVAIKLPHPTNSAFDTWWLHDLANVTEIVTDELRSTLAKGSEMKLTHEKAADGARKLVVTVEVKAGLDDDYVKNKFLQTSDHRRVYRFDAESKRLEDLKVYLHQKGGDVLIFEVTRIDYNQKIDPAVFTLELPEDVAWYEPPRKLPDNEKYEQMKPQQAARAFFEACAKEDWQEVKKFFPAPVDARLKKYLGGLEIIRIGEPFQSKAYPGWFVPYEIKLKINGSVKKHTLSVRKDNPAKRYVVDGGI